jgi:hypothetical protein
MKDGGWKMKMVSPHSNFDGTEKVQPFCFGSRCTQNGGDQEVCWVNHFFF